MSVKIKKAFLPLMSLLEVNMQVTVGDIIDQIIELAEAGTGRGGESNVLRNAQGEVIAIYCYYHKMWEPVAEVEYSLKTSSKSGLNNMCKEGTSQWTKQNNAAKKAIADLLPLVSSGDLDVADIPEEQAIIEEARAEVVPREDGIGYTDTNEIIVLA